jgi:hypothetical protein
VSLYQSVVTTMRATTPAAGKLATLVVQSG